MAKRVKMTGLLNTPDNKPFFQRVYFKPTRTAKLKELYNYIVKVDPDGDLGFWNHLVDYAYKAMKMEQKIKSDVSNY